MSDIKIKRYIEENKFNDFKIQLSLLATKIRASHGELDLQIRDDYLNIYYKGNSLAKVKIKAKVFIISVNQRFGLENAINKVPGERFQTNQIRKSGDYHEIQIDPSLLRIFFQDKIIKALATKIRDVNYGEEITFEQSIITDNIDNDKFIIIDRCQAPGLFSSACAKFIFQFSDQRASC